MSAGPARWLPYCGTAPEPGELAQRWNGDPVLLLVLGGLAVLLWRMSPRAEQRAMVAAALALSLVLFVSPLCALASALFSVRVVHHVALVALLAPVLVLTRPRDAMALPGGLATWTGLHALAFWFWHAPSFYGAALSSDVLYWAMQISLLGSAVGFWAALRGAGGLQAVGALLVSTVQMGLLGALIVFAPTALYAPHWATTQAWGLSPLDDQQIAGLVMWIGSAAIYLAAALYVTARWLALEEREWEA